MSISSEVPFFEHLGVRGALEPFGAEKVAQVLSGNIPRVVAVEFAEHRLYDGNINWR